MYGCFTRGNHKKRDILRGILLNLHSYNIWKYSSRWCSRVSGNVAPFRSVIFTFYDYNISDSAKKMFSYYQRKGLAQVLPWNLSTYITVQDVTYHGQSFSMQDCLFRSNNRLNVVAFNDLVEFITPLQNENMPSLLYSIHVSIITIVATVLQAQSFPL